ncbi:MAG: GNAT family N-acetyltransferase [Alphaproteobacteria bacterium]|nr:GNAT family N-acetyltransferase [Alphaproteobacteria bacterium]
MVLHPPVTLRACAPAAIAPYIDDLCDVLLDCVAHGASVNFMADLTHARARRFWEGVCAADDGRVVIIALDAAGRAVGTAQMVPAPQDNQPHRAEVSKMLVHTDARRSGLGAALLAAVEQAARDAGKTLLTLDTASDEAARLYARGGFEFCGSIPGYALLPDGAPCDTLLYYKRLD